MAAKAPEWVEQNPEEIEELIRKEFRMKGLIIAEVKIMVPKQLTMKEREMFEELDKISKFNPRSTKNI